MAYGLTPSLARVMSHLRAWQTAHGTTPSLATLGHTAGRSKGGIHRALTALEERGHVRRVNSRGQALELEILTPPPTASLAPDGTPLFFLPAPHKTGAPC